MKKLLLGLALLSLVGQGYGWEYDERCCPCGSFTIGGDWLYWKMFQDGMDYASFVAFEGNERAQEINSRPIAPHFQGNHGFRVFAEYEFCPQAWYVSGTFTRLISHSNQNSFANFGSNEFMVLDSTLFPIYTIFNDSGDSFFLLENSLASSFNYFDLDFGFPLCVHSCFDIVPHMGLRGLWMRQQFNLSGEGRTGGGTPQFVSFFSELRQKFDGYGLEGGINGYLRLGCGFSFIGQLGGSLLYARINATETVESGIRTINGREQFSHLSPMIDGFLGVEYCGNCCCFPFNLHVGWEQHIIFNSNNLGLITSADTTFQGLTLGGSVSF